MDNTSRLKSYFNLSKIDFLLIFLLVSAAFYVRFVAFSASALDFFSDDAVYMSMARAFSEGNFERILHPHWQLLYPLAGAFSHLFISDWAVAARSVSIVSGSLLVIPVYLLVKVIVNRYIAVLACILVVFFKPLVGSSILPLSEALYTFLVWATLLLCWKAIGLRKKKIAFLGGAVSGLAFLTRSEGVFLPLSFVLFYFYYTLALVFKKYLIKRVIRDSTFFHTTIKLVILVVLPLIFLSVSLSTEQNMQFLISIISLTAILSIGLSAFSVFYITLAVFYFRIHLKVFRSVFPMFIIVLVFTVGFFIIYSPYKIALNQKFHGVSFFVKIMGLHLRPSSAFALNQDATSTWAQDFWGVRTANPNSELLQRTSISPRPLLIYDIFLTDGVKRIIVFTNTYIFHYLDVLGWILVVLGVVWLCLNFNKRRRLLFFFLSLILTFLGMCFFAPTANERYLYWLLPIFPIAIVFGIYGLITVKFFNYSLRLIIFTLLFGYVLIKSGSFYEGNYEFVSNDIAFRKGGYTTKVDYWLLEHSPKARIMAIHEGLGFYSRSFFIYSPEVSSLAELVGYAHTMEVDYIIAASRELNQRFNYLFLEPKDYPGLKMISRDGGGSVIYKVI